MKILVVGGGGREHAIIKSLKKSPRVTEIFAAPGNGGIAADAICTGIGAKDLDAITAFAKDNAIDFAVVAPDDPLVLGAVDRLEAIGIPCFGPNKAAAILEGSKVFSKDLMKKYHIPTAEYAVFDDMDQALAYLKTAPIPTVVKADGVAAETLVIDRKIAWGTKNMTKGPAMTREEAEEAVRACMEDKIFGESGSHIVIEEFLTGPEVSVLSFTDGNVVIPMVSSMDHKRALDGDKGPNTGGMGAVAPNPYYTKELAAECIENIFLPTIRAMRAEGRPFRGCLYFGLMLTKSGPKVVEYNCRFGDPETQAVLPLLKSDLLTVMQATTNGTLADASVEFSTGSACCVVLASEGYPKKYESGFPITMSEEAAAHCYVAGAKKDGDTLLTAGGRVLGITAAAPTLRAAVEEAYRLAEGVAFANKYCRGDIGSAALAAREERG